METSLLEDLRRFDVPVIEMDGWKTRGKDNITPKVGVNHHTAGPRSGITPSLGIVTYGRSDVPGPLANVLGGRDLVARLVAAGRSNNAGKGGWKGISGNSNTLGLEMEHVGYADKEPVTEEAIDFMARIQAAFAWNRYSADYVCQHYEWTSRKIDFVEGSFDPDKFRLRVADYLKRGGAKPLPKPPTNEEIEMSKEELDKIIDAIETTKPYAVRAGKDGYGMNRGDVWIIEPTKKYHIDRDTLNALYYTRSIRIDKNGQPALVDPKDFKAIPVAA